MTKKLTLTLVTVIVMLAGSSAFANTISVGPITNSADGSGGMFWFYPIIFDNSTVSAAQPTAFNLNDFGALKTTGSLPLGYSFSPALPFTFTLDNTQNVGPSFGLPGFQPNNASVKDVVVTFTGGGNMGLPFATFTLTLDTALTATGGLANFFSQDIVQTGALAGTPNAVQEDILTPAGAPPPRVPEPGVMTTMMLGVAGLGLVRRKLSKAS